MDGGDELPTAVRIASRPSLLGDRQVLACISSDLVAQEMLALSGMGGSLTAFEVRYTIAEEDARVNVIERKLNPRTLWRMGMKAAEPCRPRSAPTGMEGLPSASPDEVMLQR